MNRSKPKWKGLLKFLGPIFFIFLIIRVVDPRTAVALIKEIDLGLALTSILLTPFIIGILTFRWWIICHRLGIASSVTQLFQINYISWFLSVVPLVGVSALAKILYLKEEGKPAGKTALSVTLDKLFDVLGQVFFSFFALIYFPEIFLKDMHRWILFATGFIAIFVVLIFWSKLWSMAMEVLKRYSGKRIQRIGENLENELSEFWSRFDLNFLSKMLAISIALGIIRSLVLYLLAISLNIPVGFILIIACRALIGIVNSIPVSINGLGTRDAILLFALPLAGVSKEAAIALGFVAFLWTIASKFSGVVFWFKHPLPISGVRSIKEKLIQ
jgi:uncharacterized protein (TIRG00374 family)